VSSSQNPRLASSDSSVGCAWASGQSTEYETSHGTPENTSPLYTISTPSPCTKPGSNTSRKTNFHTCFSTFRGTLTYLSLENFSTSFSAFVTLVDYFPNIRTLQLHSFVLEPDEGPVPSLSRPLRGRLHIEYVLPDRLEFFNKFAKLELEYEELRVDSLDAGTEFLESALQISTNTIKYLKLATELRCGWFLHRNRVLI